MIRKRTNRAAVQTGPNAVPESAAAPDFAALTLEPTDFPILAGQDSLPTGQAIQSDGFDPQSLGFNGMEWEAIEFEHSPEDNLSLWLDTDMMETDLGGSTFFGTTDVTTHVRYLQ